MGYVGTSTKKGYLGVLEALYRGGIGVIGMEGFRFRV